MEWTVLLWGLPAILMLLLLSAGVEDVRTREIAKWKTAGIALLAPLWWFAIGLPVWPGVAAQFGVALAVFALFCLAFYFGQMGGGDVKLIGAVALWLPLAPLLQMLLVMSIAGGVLTLIMLADHRIRKSQRILEVPYGVAIVFAALAVLHEPLLNQFA